VNSASVDWYDSRETGGPGRDRTDDLFHAMEARSQLRHRPTCGDTTVVLRMTSIILAECGEIVNANRLWRGHSCPRNAKALKSRRREEAPKCGPSLLPRKRAGVPAPHASCTKLFRPKILPFLPQGFSGIIDRAPHLHNFPITT
jgi:hypothetical protein